MYAVRQGPFYRGLGNPVWGPQLVSGLEPAGLDTNDELTANGLAAGAPVLGTPTISQGHVLGANGLAAGAPIIGQPTLSQVHAFAANSLSAGAPVIGHPAIAQGHVLVASALATGAPTLGHPLVGTEGNHALEALGIATGAPTIGSPSLAQIHVLVAQGILVGAPQIGSPVLTEQTAAPYAPEFFGAAGWIGIPQTIRKWSDLPLRWIKRKIKKRPPAAPEQLLAGTPAPEPPAPLPPPPPPPAQIVLDFAESVKKAARARRKSELQDLVLQVNRLRSKLGMPAWEKAIAFPEGLQYYYLSKGQLRTRMLRDELVRLRAMRKRAA